MIKRIALLTWNIFWKAVIIAAIVVLAVVLENQCESKIPSYIVGVLDLIALIVGIITVFKVDIVKYFPKNK